MRAQSGLFRRRARHRTDDDDALRVVRPACSLFRLGNTIAIAFINEVEALVHEAMTAAKDKLRGAKSSKRARQQGCVRKVAKRIQRADQRFGQHGVRFWRTLNFRCQSSGQLDGVGPLGKINRAPKIVEKPGKSGR